MTRARRVPLPSPSSPSLGQSALRLASVTGQTAVQNAQEVGTQLMAIARQALRGTQSASVTIARDLADVARRTVGGVTAGLHEVRADLNRPRQLSRKPAAKAAPRRKKVRSVAAS